MMRRLLRWIGYVVVLAVALVVTAAIVVETDWFKERVRQFAVQWSAKYLNGELSIGRLGGSLLRGVTLENVLLAQGGQNVLAAKTITVHYDPFVLARRQVAFADITIESATLRVVQDRNGWNVANLLRPLDRTGPPVDFSIARITLVDGDVTVEPKDVSPRHVSDVDFNGRLTRHGGQLSVTIDKLTGNEERTGFRVTELSGSFTGALEGMNVAFAAESPRSRANGRVSSEPVATGRRFAVAADVTSFDVSKVVENDQWATNVTGHATAMIDMPPAPKPAAIAFTFNGPRASGFGYEGRDIEATGQWTDGRLAFAARALGYGARAAISATWQTSRFSGSGSFSQVDMTRLPTQLVLPKFSSQLAGKYSVVWQPGDWTADVTLERSTIEDAVLSAGLVGHVEAKESGIRYSANGEIANFNVRRIAGPLDLPSLAAARYESRLNGPFQAEGLWTKVAGERSLEAIATLHDSTVADTHVDTLDVTATLTGQRLAIGAIGDFEKLTAVTAGLPESYTMDVNGTADVQIVLADLSAPMAIDAVDVTGRVELSPSTLQGFAVKDATITGALAKGTLTLEEFNVEAEEGQAAASGTLALGETGESSLSLKIGVDDLRPIGDRLGRPIAGAADIDAKIEGPPSLAKATGTMNARQLAYGETATALTLAGSFSAEVPNRQFDRAKLDTKSEGTFLKVGSFEILRWTGNVGYLDRQLNLETHLEEQNRQVDLAGTVGLETEAREIRIQRLAMTTGGTAWGMPEGREARVGVHADRVHVNDLLLTRADQQIEITGALAFTDASSDESQESGEPDAPNGLKVEARQVQIADINQLLLGTRQLDGVANGTVVVSGTVKAPVIDAELAVTNGSVDTVHYDGVHGTVKYDGGRATIDATLDQTADNHLTVAGTVPILSADGSAPGQIDLKVTSSPIALGLVQAFTTEIDNVIGTGVFDLRVTGTRQAPNLDGSVVLTGGGFDVPLTGVRYENVAANFQFKERHLQIASFGITDEHGEALSIVGGLDVLGETAGSALDLRMTTKSFEVLDNEAGQVHLEADLELKGGLAEPSIVGRLRVDQGRIELDRVLEQTTKSVYSTKPQVEEDIAAVNATVNANGARPAPDSAGAAEPVAIPVLPAASKQGTLFDRLALSLDVDVPDNLVVRGRDLRVGGASMGLGDTNVVTGGTLQLRKPAGGQLTLAGALEIVRGYYAFQGRRFEVQRDSTVRFRGTETLDPQIDVTATRLISGVDTSVQIRGTVQRPQLTLSSRPPLDTADILALIVFGQPANDLGVSQRVSLAERAGSMAAGAIATPLAASVARALNLDLFEIQAPSGDSKAPVVSLGSQIGTRLYVGVRQEIGSEEGSALSVEYRFADFMRLVTSVAQGGQQQRTLGRTEASGVDLIFVFRY